MRADNFSVSVLLLMAATVFIMFLRHRRPVEDNWPLVYWVCALIFALTEFNSFKTNVLLVGLFTAMLLRFEFMNSVFVRLLKTLEICVFTYVLLRGIDLVM